MTYEQTRRARLIPVYGISGAQEQEARATSALMAVMSVVSEFGQALTRPLGAPSGKIETFIEVPFKTEGKTEDRPDGLVEVTGRRKTWTALVEVKTGTNELKAEQVVRYLELARERGFDAVLTISNEIPPMPGQHPLKVDGRKTRSVSLHHLSWTQVLTVAVQHAEFHRVADPEQSYILSELIRYLEDERSGAMSFLGMGSNWSTVRDAVAARSLRASDQAAEVANRFDALLHFACLKLGRRLGTEVLPQISSRERANPASRSQALTQSLVSSGVLSGVIRVPHAVGSLTVEADLRAAQVRCSIDIDAPLDMQRATTRIKWLTRQLGKAPENVTVEVLHSPRDAGPLAPLKDVLANPEVLASDPDKEIKRFRVSFSAPVRTRRGKDGFADSVVEHVERFYADVVEGLKVWSPAPPALRSDPHVDLPGGDEALSNTALSSQDGTESVIPTVPGQRAANVEV